MTERVISAVLTDELLREVFAAACLVSPSDRTEEMRVRLCAALSGLDQVVDMGRLQPLGYERLTEGSAVAVRVAMVYPAADGASAACEVYGGPGKCCCTRVAGHAGPHVAHDTRDQAVAWWPHETTLESLLQRLRAAEGSYQQATSMREIAEQAEVEERARADRFESECQRLTALNASLVSAVDDSRRREAALKEERDVAVGDAARQRRNVESWRVMHTAAVEAGLSDAQEVHRLREALQALHDATGPRQDVTQ